MRRRGLVLLVLGLWLLSGCAEVTRPTPTVSEIEACQLAALRRHPHNPWVLERASRVFLRVLATLPQVHGRTYPFLGFNWWVTETGKIAVDNVWRPSPAAEAGLRQGDVILAVNNWPLYPWVADWDQAVKTTRDLCRDVLWVSNARTYRDKGLSQHLLVSVLPGELLVAILLDLKHIAMETRGRYVTGPVELFVARDGEKFALTLYPQHLPADYAILVDSSDWQINAYAAPGRVILSRRLVSFCLNDDELAMVVGHELAHQALGHLVRGAGYRGSGLALGKVWKLMGGFATQTLSRLTNWRQFIWVDEESPAAVEEAVVSVFSREDEREADAYGLWYAYQAGYDVERALAFWERLACVDEKDPFRRTYFLEGHPASMERLARLKRLARCFKGGRAAEVFLQSADLDLKPPAD